MLNINEELLGLIKAVRFYDNSGPISFEQVKSLPPKTEITMELFCIEEPKYKLKSKHYANLLAEEAKIYIDLGISEGGSQ